MRLLGAILLCSLLSVEISHAREAVNGASAEVPPGPPVSGKVESRWSEIVEPSTRGTIDTELTKDSSSKNNYFVKCVPSTISNCHWGVHPAEEGCILSAVGSQSEQLGSLKMVSQVTVHKLEYGPWEMRDGKRLRSVRGQLESFDQTGRFRTLSLNCSLSVGSGLGGREIQRDLLKTLSGMFKIGFAGK